MGYISKQDLLKKLVEDFDCDEKEISGKTRDELAELVNTLDKGEVQVEVEQSETADDTEEKVVPPCMGDYEWHDYVMGFFHKDELMDGNPTVDGMRRVVECLVGEILECRTLVVGTPSEDNQYRASVVVTVVVYNADNAKLFDGAADAFAGNAEPEYARHAVALAETRAEGRALKRIVKLRKVISAEEIVDSSKIVEPIKQSGDVMADTQYNFVDILAKPDKADINIEALVKSLHPKVVNIRQLTHEEAASLCNLLAEYRNGRKEPDASVKGYDKSWKESFG